MLSIGLEALEINKARRARRRIASALIEPFAPVDPGGERAPRIFVVNIPAPRRLHYSVGAASCGTDSASPSHSFVVGTKAV
jgi:hypothetical protein